MSVGALVQTATENRLAMRPLAASINSDWTTISPSTLNPFDSVRRPRTPTSKRPARRACDDRDRGVDVDSSRIADEAN